MGIILIGIILKNRNVDLSKYPYRDMISPKAVNGQGDGELFLPNEFWFNGEEAK